MQESSLRATVFPHSDTDAILCIYSTDDQVIERVLLEQLGRKKWYTYKIKHRSSPSYPHMAIWRWAFVCLKQIKVKPRYAIHTYNTTKTGAPRSSVITDEDVVTHACNCNANGSTGICMPMPLSNLQMPHDDAQMHAHA